MTTPKPILPTAVKPLRRLATIRSSNVDKVMEEGEEIVYLCNYVDVYYNDRITGQIEFSQSSANPQEIKRFGLKAGDVVITKDSETPDDIAVPALVEPSAEGVVCGYHLAILRPKETEVVGPYLFWCLNSKPVREAFGIEAQGITRYGLTLGGIKSILIPTPDLDTQKAIVAFLDAETARIDQIIEKSGGREAAKVAAQGSLLSLLLEKRAAIITAVVAGQIDVRRNASIIVRMPDQERFRLIVGAEIVHRHQNTRRFGRIKNQKLLFLAEAHAGIRELAGNYVRFAAGPYDAGLIAETERAMEAASYFSVQPASGDSRGVTYIALQKAGQHAAELKALLGDRDVGLRRLIDLLHDFDTEAVEAIATLYAVWNDALMDGQQPDDDAIVRGVLTEWHRDKAKFTTDTLRTWLDWMKRNGLTPSGQGPRTVRTMTPDMFS